MPSVTAFLGSFLCSSRRFLQSLMVLALATGCACRDPLTEAGPRSETVDAAAAPAVDPTLLRAATFNTRLFFDTTCDSGMCAAGDFEQVPSPAAFARRAEQLAAAIRAMHADIVALQEIESQASLDALSGHLQDLYPTAVLGETGLPGSIDVAVLGGGALLQVRRHRDRPLTRPDGSVTSFARELLEVHLMLRGRRVILFAAHFRSKVNDDPGRRLAEAQAARDILVASAQEFPEAVVLLGGDLNDTPGSPPLAALEGAAALLRVAADRPPASVTTYVWQGQGQAIDHLFLVRGAPGAYVAASAAAVHDPSGSAGLAGSDHAALRADFKLQ
jgi:endonuclease/exonuclease/phosphatase family metal-dependent hydrolase